MSDVGMSEWRRQLEYKGKLYGCKIVLADRFYPSSKTCNVCGWIFKDLKLENREWTCLECGTKHDRDFNASVNLEKVAASSAETQNACEGRGPLADPQRIGQVASVQQELNREPGGTAVVVSCP